MPFARGRTACGLPGPGAQRRKAAPVADKWISCDNSAFTFPLRPAASVEASLRQRGQMKILIVEDQPRVGLFIERALAEQNYAPSLAETCSAARQAVARSQFSAIVLDLGLPDGDGLDLLREWRASGLNIPVIILSARDAIADRIKGLNLGADDYLPKPFSVDELVARVRSLLRRNSGAKATVLRHGPLQVDLVAHSVVLDGARVEMTSREYSLLELFLQNPGRILTRTLIAEKVWESNYGMETNLIDVYVRRLRKKLERSPDRPLIKTVRGTGYELV